MNSVLPEKIPFTAEGFLKLKVELETLTKKRKEVLVSLQTAREMGDLSENAAYKAARFELGDVDRRLRKLNFLLRFCEVKKPVINGVAGFGNNVIIDDCGKELNFTLVSMYESDPSRHKLSIQSPLGKAILGKHAGDKVIVNAPQGKMVYILKAVK